MTTDYRMLDRVPGQRLMTVRACDIERIEKYDLKPALSYLNPDNNSNNAKSVNNFLRLFASNGGDRPQAITCDEAT